MVICCSHPFYTPWVWHKVRKKSYSWQRFRICSWVFDRIVVISNIQQRFHRDCSDLRNIANWRRHDVSLQQFQYSSFRFKESASVSKLRQRFQNCSNVFKILALVNLYIFGRDTYRFEFREIEFHFHWI